VQRAQEQTAALLTLTHEQGIPQFSAMGTILQGWVLAEQGHQEEGIAQIRQGMAGLRATRQELGRPYFLALLAEAYSAGGQVEEGMSVLTEALEITHNTGECMHQAELYRLKGTLTLQKFQVSGSKFQVTSPQHPAPSTQAEAEAEACFLKAIEIARRQSAKSLELRAVMSLSRLWQSQGKKKQARQMLAEIYGWFTEGFDTVDLQEVRALLEELGG